MVELKQKDPENLPHKDSTRKDPSPKSKFMLNESEKLPHNFYKEASFIIQTLAFAGFYQPFSSPMLYLICFLGVFIQLICNRFMFRCFYTKDKDIDLMAVVIIIKYGLIFYAIGNLISVQNSQFLQNVLTGDQIINNT